MIKVATILVSAVIAIIAIWLILIWSEDMKVNVFSEAAVITGTQKATARTAEGKMETGATAFTDIFVKEKGRWVLTIAHGVELQTMPESK